MTDNDFLASVLADGEWHGQQDILARSARERGCGLTVHSRVSDLRIKHGWTIEHRSRRTSSGRVASSYRMLARPALEAPAEARQAPQLVSSLAGASSVDDRASIPSGRSDDRADSPETSALELVQPSLFDLPKGATWEPGAAA